LLASILTLALAAAPALRCDVLDYSGWREAPDQQWDYRWPAATDTTVTIMGAEHARDPAHEQFARIAKEFANARPTLALFEGPDRGVRDSADKTISETGESGYLRFLAQQAGIEARTLEPSPADQIRMLHAEYPADQVALFFVLREAARLRDREGKTGEALDAAVASLLQKIRPLADSIDFALPFSDVAGLQAAAARYWPGRDWRTLPSGWFSPTADDARTGGVFTGAINKADSRNRDRHMVRLISEATKAGERPFVVVGRNHVPMQAPALDCLLRQ
jgi:hypothetical protein